MSPWCGTTTLPASFSVWVWPSSTTSVWRRKKRCSLSLCPQRRSVLTSHKTTKPLSPYWTMIVSQYRSTIVLLSTCCNGIATTHAVLSPACVLTIYNSYWYANNYTPPHQVSTYIVTVQYMNWWIHYNYAVHVPCTHMQVSISILLCSKCEVLWALHHAQM